MRQARDRSRDTRRDVRRRSHAAGVARPARDQRPAEHRHARANDWLARFICHASTHGRVLPHENAQIDGTLAVSQLQRRAAAAWHKLAEAARDVARPGGR